MINEYCGTEWMYFDEIDNYLFGADVDYSSNISSYILKSEKYYILKWTLSPILNYINVKFFKFSLYSFISMRKHWKDTI